MANFGAEYGDVRILSSSPELLASRLRISGVMFAGDLPDAEQRARYPDDTSLVPDPTTIRACTDAEIAHYTTPTPAPSETDVTLYLGEEGRDLLRSQGMSLNLFGRATFPAGELTTTPTRMGADTKVGMHIDSGEGFQMRLGICLQGRRQLLVGSHSAPLLLGESDLFTRHLRELFRDDPALFGRVACLHVILDPYEVYAAWTGGLMHDGSSFLSTKEREGDGAPSSVIFARQ